MKKSTQLRLTVGFFVLVIGSVLTFQNLYSKDTKSTLTASSSSTTSSSLTTVPKAYSDKELLALTDNKYVSGKVPLGDYKYVTNGAKKGYVYLCHANKDNPGSMVNGPWMSTSTWNFLKKISVDGNVKWASAIFKNSPSTSTRSLSGNGLPINHTTGAFPVAATDDAHAYDPNPNTISSQKLQQNLPLNPVYSSTPYCMGGEVGVMLSGVPLFNAFDAGLRDAPAHELQDGCDGHPQGDGEYHYHNLSTCFKDVKVSTVLGYALDGFPITGPLVAKDKYLTTEDLDECHGLVSDVIIDGKKKTTYHYVMTQDFPYSAGCFRGKPVSLMVISGGGPQSQTNNGVTGNNSKNQNTGGIPQPPTEAYSACSGKSVNTSCSFSTPQGTMNGKCIMIPQTSKIACAPTR